jgi:hypothetical protein
MPVCVRDCDCDTVWTPRLSPQQQPILAEAAHMSDAPRGPQVQQLTRSPLQRAEKSSSSVHRPGAQLPFFVDLPKWNTQKKGIPGRRIPVCNVLNVFSLALALLIHNKQQRLVCSLSSGVHKSFIYLSLYRFIINKECSVPLMMDLLVTHPRTLRK